MKALTWQGNHDVRVDDVPDPKIEQPSDAIIKVASSGICGSDLRLYKVLGAFIDPGELFKGLRDGAGIQTPPLDPSSSGPLRVREFTTGVGAVDKPR